MTDNKKETIRELDSFDYASLSGQLAGAIFGMIVNEEIAIGSKHLTQIADYLEKLEGRSASMQMLLDNIREYQK